MARAFAVAGALAAAWCGQTSPGFALAGARARSAGCARRRWLSRRGAASAPSAPSASVESDVPVSRLLLCSSLATATSVPLRVLLRDWMRGRESQAALYVPTAFALRPDAPERAAVMRADLEARLDLDVGILDLDNYARWAKFEGGRPRPDEGSVAEIRSRVAGASMLIVAGGNTFYLQAAIRASGFDGVAKHFVGSLGLPYVGQSAGGIVAGETISTAFWKGWDDPAVAPRFDFAGDPELTRGMDLIGGKAIFPHYVPEDHQALVEQRRGELANPGGLVTLAENEALVWTRDGGRSRWTKMYGDPPSDPGSPENP
mmetsp:Transcript_17985/g.47508  ORF Transcript_17985/g.47508 Transcript_17985/m.47508 type:complete len:316 (-) Transcript_17985:20-967(-)